MRMLSRSIALAGIAMLAVGSAAQAQKGKVELGIDAGVGFTLNDPNVTTVQIPTGQFRVGFFMSDRVSFEPALTLNYLKVESLDAITNLGLDAGLLYHFGAMDRNSQFYLRPLVGIEYTDLGGGLDGTQFNAGAGLGVKVRGNDRMSLRFEGAYRHGFESDNFAATDGIQFTIGFSFFPKA